jgi:hypothetical protein
VPAPDLAHGRQARPLLRAASGETPWHQFGSTRSRAVTPGLCPAAKTSRSLAAKAARLLPGHHWLAANPTSVSWFCRALAREGLETATQAAREQRFRRLAARGHKAVDEPQHVGAAKTEARDRQRGR